MIIMLTYMRACINGKIQKSTLGDGTRFGFWIAGMAELAIEAVVIIGVVL